MTEPTTSAAAAGLAASLSGITLALLGVEYYALLWALVGALLAMSAAASMTRGRAIAYVALSTLVGAAFGHFAIAMLGAANRPLLIIFSLVGGAGAQQLVFTAIAAIASRIAKTGGEK